MKKTILTLVCVLAGISASAQFKIEAGGNFGGYNKMEELSGYFGYFANVLYDINVGSSDNENYFIETGVGYLTNNISDSDNNSLASTTWVKIPVLFGSDFCIGKGYLTASAGLYYARGISGKIENSGVSLDIMNNEVSAINIFGKNDFGVEGKAGYTFGMGLGIFLGYQYGLLNLAAQSGSQATSDILFFGISYKLF